MSILIKILRVKLDKKPVNNIILSIFTKNEEISSQLLSPQIDPTINFSFLVNKQIKIIGLAIQQQITNQKYHIVGTAQFFLYNIYEIRERELAIRFVNLKKIIQNKIVNQFDQLAGTIAFEISWSSHRKILSQLQQIQCSLILKDKEKDKNDSNIIDQKIKIISQIQKQKYQEIQISIDEKQSEKKSSKIYSVDNEGYVILKPTKPQIELNQILQQLNDKSFQNQQKLKISQQQKKQYSQLDPSKLRESNVVQHIRMKGQTIKKPPIFQIKQMQKDHIDVNTTSNMFQVYHMCCGQQIDTSHQIQQTY